MADRPWVDFAAVKEKVSIPDVLEVFEIADRFRESKGSLVGCCPLPQHQHGPRPNESQFRIDCKHGLWLYKCFGDCAESPLGGGDVINFVKAMTGLSDAHVRFWFDDHFGERLNGKKPKQRSERKTDPPKEEARPVRQTPKRAETQKSQESNVADDVPPIKPLRFRLNLNPDVPYLRQRGLTEDTIERFGLGLCSRGCLAGYVAIPVYQFPRKPDESPVAYLGRWPGEDFDEKGGKPRYKWPEGFEKSRVVYGLQEAMDATDDGDSLILVEGCFSTFHLVQQGIEGAVASFGASLSDKQAALLIETGRPIILMYDANETGRMGMRKAAAKLITAAYVRVVKLPDRAEPDDFDGDELRRLIGL